MEAAPTPAGRERRGPFRSLRHPNFRLWSAGALVSNIGTWMQRTAQDWLVLTQLTHRDARALGAVMALQYAPQLLLLPWTGHAADHMDRRRVLLATQAAMGVLSLALGALTLAGAVRLWEVYVFALLFGAAAAFDAPVRQTFVGELVGDDDLANAVALNSTSFNAAAMVGPVVAGFSIAAIGTGWAFVANGVSFFAVLASLFLLRQGALYRRPRPQPGSLFEGFRYVAGRADLRAIAVMLFLIGTFVLNFPIFISTMAVGTFHADAARFGLLNAALAVGTLAGAFLATGRNRPSMGTLANGSAVLAAGLAAGALAPSYGLFAAALVLSGVAAMTLMNASNTLMQLSSEPGMRGRVMAIRLAIALGGTALGAPLVGWVARDGDPRWALGLAAAAAALTALVGLRHQRRDGQSSSAA